MAWSGRCGIGTDMKSDCATKRKDSVIFINYFLAAYSKHMVEDGVTEFEQLKFDLVYDLVGS